MKLIGQQPQDDNQNELAKRIAAWILKRQYKVADYLNKKTNGTSVKNLLFALICFSTLFGCYCIYLIISAIN